MMNNSRIQQCFFSLLSSLSHNKHTHQSLWEEIESSYSNPQRHYHTLTHLENVLSELISVKNKIQQWEAVLFALFYHDIVYDVLKQDNEEASAAIVETRMIALNIRSKIITQTAQLILATKKHELHANQDINFFTDADLSILGKPWNDYEVYAAQIRQEYIIYPDEVYFPGREKVLNHFLNMSQIFKSDFFFDKYETQAKANLELELRSI
jgi:predicted metal-dependent HD superfamily phosphohydrolase